MVVYRLEMGASLPPLHSFTQILHHVVDLHAVDLRIVPAATVRGLSAAAIVQHGHKVLIGAAATCQAAGFLVQSLIVANPEGDVPGLPVCPAVESGVHWFCLN